LHLTVVFAFILRKHCNIIHYSFICRRNGSDLILRLEIELVEALCGFQKVIKTLDDRSLVISAPAGKVKLLFKQ